MASGAGGPVIHRRHRSGRRHRGAGDVKADGARPLIVCGAGSAGVDSRELEHHVGNHYQVIELLRVPRVPAADFVRVTWSELPVDSDITWKRSPPWVIQG